MELKMYPHENFWRMSKQKKTTIHNSSLSAISTLSVRLYFYREEVSLFIIFRICLCRDLRFAFFSWSVENFGFDMKKNWSEWSCCFLSTRHLFYQLVYVQLLRVQIAKVQKAAWLDRLFLRFWDLWAWKAAHKMLVKSTQGVYFTNQFAQCTKS